MRTTLPIATKKAQGRSVPLSAERLVNMYAEASPQGARSPAWVHNTPGWASFTDLQSYTLADFSGTEAAGIINEINPTGQLREVAFKADGTKMYLNIQPYTIYEYSLSTAWDLSTYAATGQTYQLAANGHGMAFKPDGTRVWATTTAGSESVHSYTLSTAWDLSTISDDSISFAPSLGGINAIQFKTDGTKMYILDVSGDVNQYTLSTAWDITSAAVATGTLSLKSSAGDWNFTLSSDGITVYEVSDHTTSAKRLYSYTLSTPWDISTAGAAVQLAEGGGPTGVPGYRGNDTGGLFIAPDAGHWYTCDSFGYVYQYEYTLTTGATDSTKKRIRGLHVMPQTGKLYCVVGTSLYYIDSDGDKALLGAIGGSGRVSMADNGLQLCIVSQGISYIYTEAGGLSSISDSDFPNADTVTFIDGYFVFNNNQSNGRGQFFISDLLDGTAYDALDYATAERYPDNLKRVMADHSELLLFGAESIEVWYNSGNADFPFSRAQGSVIEQGIGAIWSLAKIDESVMWLDNEGVVRRLQGSTPLRKSTHAIEYDISQGDWQNASAWRYAQEGHDFYILHVPKPRNSGKGGTYVYDASTDLWHERQSYEKDHLDLGFYAYAYDKHIVGSMSSGTLYEMSMDTYDEAGDPLITEMQFPQIRNEGDRFTVSKFELDMEMATEPSGNASVMLDVSGNTRTYDMTQAVKSSGNQGEYNNRVIFRRLGQHRSFTPRIRISAPCQRAIYAAYAQIEPNK